MIDEWGRKRREEEPRITRMARIGTGGFRSSHKRHKRTQKKLLIAD
jgi:hypothetical protein